MKKLIIFLLVVFSTQLSASEIDAEKSVVNFKATNMKTKIVDGTFTGMSGLVQFVSGEIEDAKFKVCIDAKTVDTGNKMRDNHLRKDDFFDVEVHPVICFESKKIYRKNDQLMVIGDLSMNGITKTIDQPFSFENNTLKGTFKVDRFEFELGEKVKTFMIGKEIEVEVICVIN